MNSEIQASVTKFPKPTDGGDTQNRIIDVTGDQYPVRHFTSKQKEGKRRKHIVMGHDYHSVNYATSAPSMVNIPKRHLTLKS